MAKGDTYVKFKDGVSTRSEIAFLSKHSNRYIDSVDIQYEGQEDTIPLGYYLLQRVYPKPEIPEGKFKGYHYKIEDGVMRRWYLICDGEDDKQLLVLEDYEDAVQKYLDDTVKIKGYDNVYTCLSYKGDPDPIFSAEADAVLNWRSQVWRAAQGILNQWQQGQIEQPTISEVISQLPTLEWPKEVASTKIRSTRRSASKSNAV